MTAPLIDNHTIPSYAADGSKLYDRIAEAIRFITENQPEQPDLDTVAAHIGMSPHHFQRTVVFSGHLALDVLGS